MKKQLVPREEAVTRLQSRLKAAANGQLTRQASARAAFPAALCAVLLVLFLLPVIPAAHFPAPAGGYAGLSVRPDRFSGMQEADGKGMIISIATVADFFRQEPDAFAIVRIESTAKNSTGKQAFSQATVLETVYGKVSESPEIQQQLLVGCKETYSEKHLLREGGVYLLPLKKYGSGYIIIGDTQVLLEINEAGRVFSHSYHAAFMRYDGKPYADVIADVKSFAQNSAAMAAASPFGTACLAVLPWPILP